MANLTTSIPSGAQGKANTQTAQPVLLTVVIPAQAQSLTRFYCLPTLKRVGYVKSVRSVVQIVGTGTVSMQPAKLNADDGTANGTAPASANVKMTSATSALDTVAAGNVVEPTLYATGTAAATDYQDANGNWIDSRRWFDQNDRLGVEVVTAAASTTVALLVTIEVVFTDGYIATRTN